MFLTIPQIMYLKGKWKIEMDVMHQLWGINALSNM